MMATRAEVLPGEPAITDDLVREHGLRPQEYDTIKSILQREPTFTELGIFSALWSEHCSYKHSRPILKLFPTDGPHVLQGPGENAGVLRLGDGWAVVFKIESHNHPTAVEPYQGAATGVGGILRDVFTMGARPVALLNSLRFGPLSDSHNRYLFAGAVRGIGDYGNCVGIPTVAGEVSFSPSYAGNPLINAMCVGVVREDEVIRAVAKGPGNVLLAVGARTGRDGIHGASFASEELTDESQARRPQVQVADPFTEKLLLEASLELIASGFIVAIQDMGAAGLTSSSAEMAARGGVGIEIDTARVPTREPDMTPYEILLSESQERMLVVALQDHVADVEEIMHKWELEAVPIGHVTEDGMYRVQHAGVIVAEIPGRQLIEECPVYHAEATEDPLRAILRAQTPDQSDPPPEAALLTLLDAPSIASKRWVFEQYDSTVQASTVIGPGHDAGVVRIPGTSIGIAVATDCTSRYVALDPYAGGKAAVVEAARNVACMGARPVGITNCLNFGSPEKTDVFFQFREVCRGIAEACSALGTPVTGGNVSFYNEHPQGVVDPTPVIGMVGVLDDVANVLRSSFTTLDDAILLLGRTRGHLGASAYWEYVLNTVAGSPPPVDLTDEKALQSLLHRVAGRSLAHSCHDVSDGGLAVALAEACIGTPYDDSPIGALVDLRDIQGNLTDAEVLFGEDQGRAILSVSPADAATVLAEARELGVPATQIGTVGSGADIFQIQLADRRIEVDPAVLHRTYFDAIPRRMDTIDPQATDT